MKRGLYICLGVGISRYFYRKGSGNIPPQPYEYLKLDLGMLDIDKLE